MQSRDSEPDFSEPWSLSDVILVVEDREFYVHKGTLAMCSPVFERMFTTDFKEKQAKKILLPDKKSDKIKEFLLVVYPFAKPVTESNVDFLLALAQEYQVEKLTARCEEVLLKQVGENEQLAVKRLITAQSYNLEQLQHHCIEVAKHIAVDYFEIYDEEAKISKANYSEIFKKRSKYLENVLLSISKSFHENLLVIANSAAMEVDFFLSGIPKHMTDEQCLTCIERRLQKESNWCLERAQILFKKVVEILNAAKLPLHQVAMNSFKSKKTTDSRIFRKQ